MADPFFSIPSRRCFLVRSAGLAAGAGFLSVVPLARGHATPQAMQEAIRKIVAIAEMSGGSF
jgi:hypothetical protein